MIAGRIVGATRVLGKSQGYIGLPVRDGQTEDGIPCMSTAWLPTQEEIDAIAKGAPIVVHLLGCAHPPISIDVGDAPD